MPLDSTGYVETKPDPFSLESLIAWLEKQPTEQTYSFISPSECLLAKYTTAHGGMYLGDHYIIQETKIEVCPAEDPTINCPDYYWVAWGGETCDGKERTFGEALHRARKLLASRS